MNVIANPDAARGALAQGGPHAGRLYVVAAPSGAGKTSLVKALMRREPQLRFSVSYTTRAARPDEVEGRDYYFVQQSRFQEMAARGEFLEYAKVFDNYYGTAWSTVKSALAAGQLLLLEIDWQGARQVRARLPAARSIFILPPSRRALGERLRSRSTDSEVVIERRLKDAAPDLAHWQRIGNINHLPPGMVAQDPRRWVKVAARSRGPSSSVSSIEPVPAAQKRGNERLGRERGQGAA